MAKIMSPLVGQGKGKIGAQVLYRANGEQLIRARAIEIKNPRSNAQMAQRIAVATASKLTASLRGIVDHSFEGVPYGEASVRFFNSKATLLIKAAINNPKRSWAPVVPGDAPFGSCPNVPLSKGSLSPVNVSIEKLRGGVGGPVTPWFLSSAGYSEEMTLSAFLDTAGISKGDQVTFVLASGEIYESAFSEEEQFAGMKFAFVRLNFLESVPDSTRIFIAGTSGDLVFNPDVLDLSKSSNVGGVHLYADSGGVAVALASGEPIVAAAVIRSAYREGMWQRSNTELETMWGVFTGIAPEDGYDYGFNYYGSVLSCYRKDKTAVEDRYLNKEDN